MYDGFGNNKAYHNLFKQVYKNYHKGFIEFEVDEKELEKINAKPINKTRKEIIRYKPLIEVCNASFPICITYGDKDIYGNSKNEVLQRYPHSKVFEIAKSGHIPWLHNKVEFEKILLFFYEQKTYWNKG